MGAAYNRRIYQGKLTRVEVEEAFDRDRSQSQYENGHSYSGAIGMLTGAIAFRSETFKTVAEADEWLNDNHNSKWGPAWAVRVEGDDGTSKWVVGGICSS